MKSKNILLFFGVGAVVIFGAAFYIVFFNTSTFSSLTTNSSKMIANNDMAIGEGAMDGGMMEESFAMPAAQMMDPGIARDIMPSPSFAPTDEANRLIIKNGSMGIEVDNVANSIAMLSKEIERLDGFVISSNMYNIEKSPRGHIQVRVPAENFEAARDIVRAAGTLQSDSVSGQDVTEEFVDIEARLETLKATEAQFLEILEQAQDVEDILSVQRELSNIRQQIESMEGRKEYLSQSAAYSTLSIDLSTNPEQVPVIDEREPWQPLAVVKDAARQLVEFGKGIVNVIIWLVIFLPLWIVVGLIIWWAKRNMHTGSTKKRKK